MELDSRRQNIRHRLAAQLSREGRELAEFGYALDKY
jgi:hypothetical protein